MHTKKTFVASIIVATLVLGLAVTPAAASQNNGLRHIVEGILAQLDELRQDIANIPAGPQGEKGEQGDQGEPGPVGPAGPAGDGDISRSDVYVNDLDVTVPAGGKLSTAAFCVGEDDVLLSGGVIAGTFVHVLYSFPQLHGDHMSWAVAAENISETNDSPMIIQAYCLRK